MNYIQAQDVTSPESRWKLKFVLRDDGPEETAFAVGEWDGEPVIGVRRNGDAESPIGHPQSGGLPTWCILPPDLNLAALGTVSEDRQMLARSLLAIEVPPVVEMKVDVSVGTHRHTLKVRESGQRMYKDVQGEDLFGNTDRLEFLEALYGEVRRHLENGSRVVLHDL